MKLKQRVWDPNEETAAKIVQFMQQRVAYYEALAGFARRHAVANPTWVVTGDRAVGVEIPQDESIPEGWRRDTGISRPGAAVTMREVNPLYVFPDREGRRELDRIWTKRGRQVTSARLSHLLCGEGGPFQVRLPDGRIAVVTFGLRGDGPDKAPPEALVWKVLSVEGMPEPKGCTLRETLY